MCVKLMTASLEVTMQHKKPIWKFINLLLAQDVPGPGKAHKTRLWCQQQKKSTDKNTTLAPLPIPEWPNLWIHADLFGPMITVDSNKKLCYASLMLLQNVPWSLRLQIKMQNSHRCHPQGVFSKFNIPAQVHRDGGKEFINKLSTKLFLLFNGSHTKMSPAHPNVMWKCKCSTRH